MNETKGNKERIEEEEEEKKTNKKSTDINDWLKEEKSEHKREVWLSISEWRLEHEKSMWQWSGDINKNVRYSKRIVKLIVEFNDRNEDVRPAANVPFPLYISSTRC